MQGFQRYLAEKGYDDIRPLVAFSGTVHDPYTGEDYTEPGMNIDVVTGKSISEAALPARFASPDYQILLVAEKYQTGFDQPLLQAMYVDKRLDGVQAVQTLSRLNRMAPGKAPPFVLDFVNDPENIRRAFEPYYDRTELLAASDPHRLEELKYELDQMQVYHWSEVEDFARVFYSPGFQQRKQDHARLEAALQPARDRFTELDDEDQTEFRDRLQAFVSLYGFLSQIIPYGDDDQERLSSFGRVLLPHLQPEGRRRNQPRQRRGAGVLPVAAGVVRRDQPWRGGTGVRCQPDRRWARATPRRIWPRCRRSSSASTSDSEPSSQTRIASSSSR